MEKARKECTNCDTTYHVTWDIEQQDLEPMSCPFCGWEVENEPKEIIEEIPNDADGRDTEDNNWD
jgi:hypothetical protein|tara:strand:+ start:2286 stop:2480 length:195 start_codon:yes stop_codon:yes gene_type:complete